jgi:hypothetical protein
MYVFWKGARTAPRLSEAFKSVPMRGVLIIPFFFFPLLVKLYGDMNLGVISGQVMDLGPTTNGAGMLLY